MVVRGRALVVLAAAAMLAAPAGLRARVDSAGDAVNALAQEFASRQGTAYIAPLAVAHDVAPAMPESEAQAKGDARWADGFLQRLHAIAPDTLAHEDALTYATLDFDAKLMKKGAQYYWLDSFITPYASPLTFLAGTFANLPLASDADRQTYCDTLDALPITFAAYEARLRGQVQRGIVLPTDELPLVLAFVRGFSAPATASPFTVDARRLAQVDGATRARFVEQVGATITDVVNPAVDRLSAYIDGPYRAHAASQVGVSRFPRGAEYYRFLIDRYVGLDLTPEQIHQIGLDEVARLEAALDQVRRDAGYAGTLAAFRDELRNDPRFRARSGEEIGERMAAAIKRIEPKIDEFFPKKPSAPYGLKALDPQRAGSMTYGYYQIPTATDPSGYYMYNGTRPQERSILMADAVIYHELVPGHHFQMALQMENTALVPFRRNAHPTAFTEGWGEYASDLAGEMGMYRDPYQRAGRLAMDLFLSSRLVVDTGMNALGWPRAKAVAYMREHTFESDLQIDTESLRYSVDIPGQALAYKLGAKHIHDLRNRIAAEQGAAFDLRAFHGYLLSAGALPLPVLDEHMACYLHERHRQ
ncbi:MAG TPA: DUF885 domain-containing protein [Vicinamibacterales bacterium]|nr:DUF885 domain-containing protein [Vicinamibacterales bacterium]